MARPLRLEYPGAVWHVTNRGVEQRDIYLDDADRELFLDLLSQVVPRYRWRLPAYTQMTNHFHLLVQTVEPTLSRGMQSLQKKFAEAFNARYRRAGHLFQGRFKAHLIDSESYLLTVARYIVRNPVRAGMVHDAGDWKWSSHRATMGVTAAPSWLDTSLVLERFDANDAAVARRLYAEFVRLGEGAPSPWKGLVGGMYLGGEAFLKGVQERLATRTLSREHVRAQRVARCATSEEVAQRLEEAASGRRLKRREVRLAFALLARNEALMKLDAIGRLLGVGATGASYLLREAEARRLSDGGFAELIQEVTERIRGC
jgi:REP element-mobilizing transposase RayT